MNTKDPIAFASSIPAELRFRPRDDYERRLHAKMLDLFARGQAGEDVGQEWTDLLPWIQPMIARDMRP